MASFRRTGRLFIVTCGKAIKLVILIEKIDSTSKHLGTLIEIQLIEEKLIAEATSSSELPLPSLRESNEDSALRVFNLHWKPRSQESRFISQSEKSPEQSCGQPLLLGPKTACRRLFVVDHLRNSTFLLLTSPTRPSDHSVKLVRLIILENLWN